MLKHWIWLTQRPGIGTHGRAALLRLFGTAERIYAMGEREYRDTTGFEMRWLESLLDKSTDEAERVLIACDDLGIQLLTYADTRYPERLRNIPDPPAVLYYKGTFPDFDHEAAIAVVGSRRCSAYGLMYAKRFGRQIANCGGLVVSGGARGIDTMATYGAMDASAPVVAVMGCGLDINYPRENKGLFEDMARRGCLISEYPPGTPPNGRHFPVRNRIISGLCAAVLIVEAPIRSGALITAERALDQGREVFVLPGSVNDPHCAGSNRLLRDGGAQLVLDPMDIVHALAGLLRQKPDGEHIREIYLRESGGQEPSEVKERSEVKKPPASRQQDPWEELRLRRQKQEKEPPRAPEKPRREKNEPYTPTMEEILARPKPTLRDISGDELLVAQVMQQGAKNPDDIIRMSGLPPSRALSALTMLEMDGLVKGSPTEVWLVDP